MKLLVVLFLTSLVQKGFADQNHSIELFKKNEEIYKILKGTRYENWAEDGHCRISWEDSFERVVEDDVKGGYFRLKKGQKLNFRCLANTIVLKSDKPLQTSRTKDIYEISIYKDPHGIAHMDSVRRQYPTDSLGYKYRYNKAGLGLLFGEGADKALGPLFVGNKGKVNVSTIRSAFPIKPMLNFPETTILEYSIDDDETMNIVSHKSFTWGHFQFNAQSVIVLTKNEGLVVLPKLNKVQVHGFDIENVGAIDAKVVGEFRDLFAMQFKFVDPVDKKTIDFKKQTVSAVAGYSGSRPVLPRKTELKFFRETLLSATLNEELHVWGLSLPVGSVLYFDRDEQLMMSSLGRSVKLGNAVWPAGTTLTFRNSRLEYLVAQEPIESHAIEAGRIYRIANGKVVSVENPYVKANESLYLRPYYGLGRLKSPARNISDKKVSIEPFNEFTISPIITVLGENDVTFALYSGQVMYCPEGADLANCQVEIEYTLQKTVKGLYGVFPRPFKITEYSNLAAPSTKKNATATDTSKTNRAPTTPAYTFKIDGVAASLSLPKGKKYYPLAYELKFADGYVMNNENEDQQYPDDDYNSL